MKNIILNINLLFLTYSSKYRLLTERAPHLQLQSKQIRGVPLNITSFKRFSKGEKNIFEKK